nr:hypothetical protein [Escherichia coli]
MKRLIAGMFLFISFGATAECWVVGDMRGISYSERNNFHPEEDGFSGTFIIKTSGEDASITYSGTDAGGMAYKALSKNSIIGIGANGETQRSLYINLCNCLILICSIQHQMKVNLWTKNNCRLWLMNWPKISKLLTISASSIAC